MTSRTSLPTTAETPRTATFPLRVACVDMGSNAIRFLAAEFHSMDEYEVLSSDRRPVRLGHGVHLSGQLDRRAMEAAIEALVAFRAEIDRLGVRHVRAVATSAVRESRNAEAFIARVREEAGLELEAISGSEEARLVQVAVARRLPLGDRRWLLVDLGGGSVEVSLVDVGGVLWSESHTMGSVRLLEELTEAGAEPGRFRRLLEEYVGTLRLPSMAGHLPVAGFIATGGNAEALAGLATGRDDGSVAMMSMEALRAVIDRLARMSFRERVDELGLREDRADVILPAAMVYERLAELCYADQIAVPRVGIKEGVLLDMVAGLTSSGEREDRGSREAVSGAVALGRRYSFDESHARHVAALAVSLFDQLASLHGLDATNRRILRVAALLHDIGQFVSYKGHHKHSLYLISHSELPAVTAREMVLTAHVARYHRKGEPRADHELFTQLAPAEQQRVVRLAAILRLADALDREHVQRVRSVKAAVKASEVVLRLEGEGDLLLESWSLRRKAPLFEKVFGRRVKPRLP